MVGGPTAPEHAQLIDVIDRVLTKGIVIAFEIDVSVAGLKLIGIDGKTVVASIETYLTLVAPSSEPAESQAIIAAAEEFLKDLSVDSLRRDERPEWDN